MRTRELQDKDDAALRKELGELHRENFKLRMQRGTGQLGRPSEIKRVRRDIARIMTLLGERGRRSESQ